MSAESWAAWIEARLRAKTQGRTAAGRRAIAEEFCVRETVPDEALSSPLRFYAWRVQRAAARLAVEDLCADLQARWREKKP